MAQVGIEKIQGVKYFPGLTSNDSRGSFIRFFEDDGQESNKWQLTIDALSMATNIEAGTLRGLHFQTDPFEQEKVVICIEGTIFDVIVDLRPESKTLGDWAHIELDADIPSSLTLPKGIAHGYQTLVPNTKVFYALSVEFSPAHAFTLNFAETELNIKWPLGISCISENDKLGISLQRAVDLSKRSH